MTHKLIYEGRLARGRMELLQAEPIDALIEAVEKARRLLRTCPGKFYLERPDGSRVDLDRYLLEQ
jgi:hypothetical protein